MGEAAKKNDEDKQGLLMIGGTKGHAVEEIDGALLKLYRAFRWKQIPQCTGRYTCRDHDIVSRLRPEELLRHAGIVPETIIEDDTSLSISSNEWKVYEFDLLGRQDRLIILPMDGLNQTGIISYVKKDTSGGGKTRYVHTLNAPSGFRRKLEAIGIKVTETEIIIEI